MKITPAVEKHIRDIANGLPVIHTGPTKKLYKHIKGNQLTRKQVEQLKLTYTEKDWEPNPKYTYVLTRSVPQIHNHFINLCKAWQKDGLEGVNLYEMAAKNISANLKSIGADYMTDTSTLQK